jgi:hypothetical protein
MPSDEKITAPSEKASLMGRQFNDSLTASWSLILCIST